MRSGIGLVGVVALVAWAGCDDAASGSGGGAAPSASSAPSASAAPSAAGSGATAEPKKPAEKKLITITTKSPEAKAAFVKAWELADNSRGEEAFAECKKAVAADAEFAFGHACLGAFTPGNAAQAELDKGVALAAKLPEAEKLTIDAWAAFPRQDFAKFYADVKRIVELAPDDFHAQSFHGGVLFDRREFPAAEAAFKKALELNPGASFIYRSLADAQTQLRKYDDALASAKKYAEASPGEPGAHQALAGALLNLDKTKEAVAELVKGVELGPKSRSAHYDLATVKAIAGDYAGARETLEKSKALEVQSTDGLERANNTAWVLFDEGKDAEAFKLLEATEKEADAHKLPWPSSQLETRAWALWALGKPADSLKAADSALARCDSRPESSDLDKGNCRRDSLEVKAFAQVEAGKVADAQKTAALLKDEAKKWPDNHWLQVDVEMLSDQVTALERKRRPPRPPSSPSAPRTTSGGSSASCGWQRRTATRPSSSRCGRICSAGR
jgi:tetratricopeptide (TPR) repeat protein